MYIKEFISGLTDAICGVAVGAFVALGLATYSATSITSLPEYEYTFCSVVACLVYLGLTIRSMKNIRYQLPAISNVEQSGRESLIRSEMKIRIIKDELRRREEEDMAFLTSIMRRLLSYRERADHFGQSHNMGYGDSWDEVEMMITDLNYMQNELQMSSELDEIRRYQLQTLCNIETKLLCWMSVSKREIFRLQLQKINSQIAIDLWKNCFKHFPNGVSSDEVQMFDAEVETTITLNDNFINQFEILRSILEDLPFITISAQHVDDDVGRCPICTDDFVLGEEAIEMPCHPSHIFHIHCVQPWLLLHHTCPTCRM